MSNRERWYVSVVSGLGVLSSVFLIVSLLSFRTSFLLCFPVSVVFATALFLVVRKHRVCSDNDCGLDITDEQWKRLFDRYTRRSINWLFVAFWDVLGGTALGLITLFVNSRAGEVASSLVGKMFFHGVIAFFLVRNLLIVQHLDRCHTYEKYRQFRKEFRLVLISSSIYWVVAIGLYLLFETVFVLNLSAFVTGLFVLGVVVYNFTRINFFTYFRRQYNRVVIIVLLLIVVVCGGYTLLSRDIWLTQPYINSVPYIYEGKCEISYDEAGGVYTVTKAEGEIRILQITDIHLGGGVLSFDKDLMALKAVFDLLEATKPDLVVVTGDLCFPVGLSSFSFNNSAPVQQFAAFMRNTGIPWAFTYGNHDTESYAIYDTTTLNEIYKSLSWKTSRTLMYPYVQPDITGRNNQVIDIRNQDGSLYYSLYLIDSNAYTGEGLNKYDFIHDDQVEWYRGEVLRRNAEKGSTVPSLVFFHIPLQQYKTAYELYEKGSNEVKYCFGENNEKMIGKVCCSQYPSSMFDTARELGSTKGFFCGHDHYNNMSLEYQGIRLTYGMSIDYLAMPGIARDTEQRGATLIVLDEDGDMVVSQVPLISVQ